MARDSPDHKLETGSESCSGRHNPLVHGSSPCGPTNIKKPRILCGAFFCYFEECDRSSKTILSN